MQSKSVYQSFYHCGMHFMFKVWQAYRFPTTCEFIQKTQRLSMAFKDLIDKSSREQFTITSRHENDTDKEGKITGNLMLLAWTSFEYYNTGSKHWNTKMALYRPVTGGTIVRCVIFALK